MNCFTIIRIKKDLKDNLMVVCQNKTILVTIFIISNKKCT